MSNEPTLPPTSLLQTNPHRDTVKDEIATVLNRHSCENGSNTPDYLLAELLVANLEAFDRVVTKRAAWHGLDNSTSQGDSDPSLTEGIMGECAKLRLQNGALMQSLSLLATLAPQVFHDALDPLRMARQIHADVLARLQNADVQVLRGEIQILQSKLEVSNAARSRAEDARDQMGKHTVALRDAWQRAEAKMRDVLVRLAPIPNPVAAAPMDNLAIAAISQPAKPLTIDGGTA